MAIRRRKGRHEASFAMRLLKDAQDAREAARRLPPGKKRETLLRQARGERNDGSDREVDFLAGLAAAGMKFDPGQRQRRLPAISSHQ
jgi:hypothetical protein